MAEMTRDMRRFEPRNGNKDDSFLAESPEPDTGGGSCRRQDIGGPALGVLGQAWLEGGRVCVGAARDSSSPNSMFAADRENCRINQHQKLYVTLVHNYSSTLKLRPDSRHIYQILQIEPPLDSQNHSRSSSSKYEHSALPDPPPRNAPGPTRPGAVILIDGDSQTG